MELESVAKVAVICASVAALGNLVTAVFSYLATRKTTKNQRELTQRQIILPLWDYISALSKIDPQKPVTPDIVKNINALELVALCCEADIVDEKVITRTFSEQFIQHFEDIKSCQDIGDGRSGTSLIKENRAAEEFYDRLNEARKSTGRIK
ncbi:hypothetical protein RY43_22680 [Salmonella enterica]|uniref:hypothetical protein n=1 Tax=Salmonella enterica TaxID=28901 RepID=UPI000239B0D4|nr:hypothetical protein [Salmonella enterica]EHJ83055.1 hypothetical protein LTSEBAI_1953 [Salmonella enterica subsp. enterica serovar Baildon str. R6-199]HCZ1698915.1 hypothetical protein [Salmonella enterica subsp. enterica serovar Anatum str. 0262]HCZ1716517.1 hypothetical protein [Salmonella enterica subsp. enterica serovar Montevideo str. 0263]EAA4612849.1 hypothetical protein [Salmonella enterica]EAA7955913.1 hypothetical protein [Salmonella enterica]